MLHFYMGNHGIFIFIYHKSQTKIVLELKVDGHGIDTIAIFDIELEEEEDTP